MKAGRLVHSIKIGRQSHALNEMGSTIPASVTHIASLRAEIISGTLGNFRMVPREGERSTLVLRTRFVNGLVSNNPGDLTPGTVAGVPRHDTQEGMLDIVPWNDLGFGYFVILDEVIYDLFEIVPIGRRRGMELHCRDAVYDRGNIHLTGIVPYVE